MRRTALFFCLLCLAAVLAACSQTPAGRNRQGNRYYDQAEYDQALAAYRQAQAEEPDLAELHYNAGNTLHRQEDYTSAITEALQGLSQSDPALRAQADYNLGNSFYRQGRFAEAIEAYKAALRLNPDDQHAKFNLELAQRQLENQRLTPSPQPSPTEEPSQGTPSPQPSPESGEGTATPTPQGGGQPAGSTPTAQPPGSLTPAPQPGEENQEGMTEEQALQLLQALGQDERTLQEVLQALQPFPDRPVDKDW